MLLLALVAAVAPAVGLLLIVGLRDAIVVNGVGLSKADSRSGST
jgi:hypothetical protein